MSQTVDTVHIPILLEPIVSALLEPFQALGESAPPHWLVDCTLGGGGHTAAFLERLPKKHGVLAVDQDLSAIEKAQKRFEREISEGRLLLVHSRFSEIEPHLKDKPVLGLMADLGFSSDQINDPERGLSFLREGPLDMRMDPTRGISCRDYLARTNERDLEKVLSEYGEERFARRIATAIVNQKQNEGVPRTTKELADLITRAVPPSARHGRIHAATRTFQALRIVVNQELEELDCLLERVILSVKPGGRVAVLSFHSLEDRKVKTAFKSSQFRALTKKPIEADEEETQNNPRARSAKLRLAERTT